MTLNEFKNAVKRESQIEEDSGWSNYLTDWLYEATIDHVSQIDDPNMRLLDVALVSPGAGQATLPSDFLKAERVIYVNGTSRWELPHRSQPTPPALVVGKPKNYDLNAATTLHFYPSQALGADSILLTYYKLPTKVTASGSSIGPDEWIPHLIRKVVARLHVYHEELNKAQSVLSLGQVNDIAQMKVADEIEKEPENAAS